MANNEFTQLFWSVIYSLPVLITYLLSALVLYRNRRVAPRPCIIAAGALLMLFVIFFAMNAIHYWLMTQFNNPAFGSQDTTWLLLKLHRLIWWILYATGIAVLIWCVMMERRPGPVADE